MSPIFSSLVTLKAFYLSDSKILMNPGAEIFLFILLNQSSVKLNSGEVLGGRAAISLTISSS